MEQSDVGEEFASDYGTNSEGEGGDDEESSRAKAADESEAEGTSHAANTINERCFLAQDFLVARSQALQRRLRNRKQSLQRK